MLSLSAKWAKRCFPSFPYNLHRTRLPVYISKFDIGQFGETEPALSEQGDNGFVPDVVHLIEEIGYLLSGQAGQEELAEPRCFDFLHRIGQGKVLLSPVVEGLNRPVVCVTVTDIAKL